MEENCKKKIYMISKKTYIKWADAKNMNQRNFSKPEALVSKNLVLKAWQIQNINQV